MEGLCQDVPLLDPDWDLTWLSAWVYWLEGKENDTTKRRDSPTEKAVNLHPIVLD